MPQAFPAQPNIEWLKKTAKQRLVELRAGDPRAKLHQAQLAIAHDYGFKSWRALKAHVDDIGAIHHDRERVFDAARAGDVEAVRRAFASGFDPATSDVDGRTIYQIAKERRHEAIELLARDLQERTTRRETEARAIRAIISAAQSGNIGELRGVSMRIRSSLTQWEAVSRRPRRCILQFYATSTPPYAFSSSAELTSTSVTSRTNAVPLHFAVAHGDLETIKLLVEAGADLDGKGDDYEVGALGWATCFRQLREDVAAYLLSWRTAEPLDGDRARSSRRGSSNDCSRAVPVGRAHDAQSTPQDAPPSHAAAKDRIVQLLLTRMRLTRVRLP